MQGVALVAVGGAVGAVLRYLVALVLTERGLTHFPWGTLVVNVVGAFLIGLVVTMAPEDPYDPWRLLLGTGLLGGFTTFSALSIETVVLLEAGRPVAGAVNLFGSMAAGLAAALVGVMAGRALW